MEKIKSYIDSFRYGCPPHAGGGIGNVIYTPKLSTALYPVIRRLTDRQTEIENNRSPRQLQER